MSFVDISPLDHLELQLLYIGSSFTLVYGFDWFVPFFVLQGHSH